MLDVEGVTPATLCYTIMYVKKGEGRERGRGERMEKEIYINTTPIYQVFQ
jgi:hypothetical protein